MAENQARRTQSRKAVFVRGCLKYDVAVLGRRGQSLENVMYTPVTLWADFDGEQPLDLSVIRTSEQNQMSLTEVYFSGRETGGGRPRIYAVFAHALGADEHAPAVVLANDCDLTVDLDIMGYFCRRGYAVLMFDYAGEREKGRFTLYPECVSYANFQRAGRHLRFAEPTARENCFYEWTGVARYAVRAAKALSGSEKIAFFGYRRGGLMAWHLAVLEPSLAACGSLFFAGWERYQGRPKFDPAGSVMDMDDEIRRYLAGIAVESYASFLKVPFLFLSGTNDDCTDMDRAYDTLHRVPEDCELIYEFSPRLYGLLSDRAAATLDLFLERQLKGRPLELPQSCELSFEIRNKVPLLRLTSPGKEAEVKVYYAFDTVAPVERDWKSLKIMRIGEGVYEGAIPLRGACSRVFAYANVTMENGMTQSSSFAVGDISSLAAPAAAGHVIYNGMMGEDSFTCYPVEGLKRQSDLFLSQVPVKMAEGPLGIAGVSGTVQSLATYKLSGQAFRGEDENLFRFDVWSRQPQTLTVVFYADKGKESEYVYRAEVKLLGGEIWQPVTLKKENFKAADGRILKTWAVSMAAFLTERPAVFNNILWV